MLSLNELRKLRGMLSLTSYCFLVKAMKTQKLSSLRYNAVVTEISEALSKDGTSERTDFQLALYGSQALPPESNFWQSLKLVSTLGIIRAFPTNIHGREEQRGRYAALISTLNANCSIMNVSLPSIAQTLPPEAAE